MPTSNFILRNISTDVMLLLKKKSGKQKTSVNPLILKIIERGLGRATSVKKVIYHDLDDLAGTWNDKDKKAFDANIKSFESVDK